MEIGWSHIILEGFCMRKTSPKKDKYLYRGVSLDPLKTERIPNREYDLNYKTPRKPKFCKNRICFTCLEKSCKYLAFCDAEKEDYKHMDKFYK